jgi:hypothetical protein
MCGAYADTWSINKAPTTWRKKPSSSWWGHFTGSGPNTTCGRGHWELLVTFVSTKFAVANVAVDCRAITKDFGL